MTNKRSLLVIILWVIALSILAGYIFLIVSEKKTIAVSWFTTQVTRAVLISILALIVGIQFNKLQKNNLTPNEKKRAATSFYFALLFFATVSLLSIAATPAAPVSVELKNVATTADIVALQKSSQKIFEQETRTTTELKTISKRQEAQHRHVDAKLTTLSDLIIAADKGAQARHYAAVQGIDTVNSRLVALAGQLEVLPKIEERVDSIESHVKEIAKAVSKDTDKTKSFRWNFIILILGVAGVLATLSWFSSKTDKGNNLVPPKWRTHYIPTSLIVTAVVVCIAYFFANSELNIGSIKEILKKDSTVVSKEKPRQEKKQDVPVVPKEEPKKEEEKKEDLPPKKSPFEDDISPPPSVNPPAKKKSSKQKKDVRYVDPPRYIR